MRPYSIYEVHITTTNKSYIGASKQPMSRFGQHLSALVRGIHTVIPGVFDPREVCFRILEMGLDDARERETYWISVLGAYNIEPKSNARLRKEKYWKIASEIHKGKLSYREIAALFGVSLGTVGNVAKKFGMSRSTDW